MLRNMLGRRDKRGRILGALAAAALHHRVHGKLEPQAEGGLAGGAATMNIKQETVDGTETTQTKQILRV